MLFASLVATCFLAIRPQHCRLERTQTFGQKFLSIEYCTGCRWDFRAFWLVQELLDRESDFDLLLMPSPIAGTFDVKDFSGKSIFMRPKGGDFPDPSVELPDWIEQSDVTVENVGLECTKSDFKLLKKLQKSSNETLPCVDVAYNTAHRQRAIYLAQECLRTFSDEVKSLSLRVSETVDELQISLVKPHNDEDKMLTVVWQRGFPATKVMKQKIRDVLVPDKSLGHSDDPSNVDEDNRGLFRVEDVDDEEAAEARKFFGVA